jgi:phage tail-like protein
MTADSDGFGGDTPVSNRFLLEIDNVEIGVFSEVRGLELNVEVESYKEGGENNFTHQFPGRITWPHITLKRGITDSDALFSWVNQSAGTGFEAGPNDNKLTRSTGAITIINTAGQRERAWNLTQVFPVKWSGPSFSATSSEMVFEELEIAHNGFTSKTFPPQ